MGRYRWVPEADVGVGSEGEDAVLAPVCYPSLPVCARSEVTDFYIGISHGYWVSFLISWIYLGMTVYMR